MVGRMCTTWSVGCDLLDKVLTHENGLSLFRFFNNIRRGIKTMQVHIRGLDVSSGVLNRWSMDPQGDDT